MNTTSPKKRVTQAIEWLAIASLAVTSLACTTTQPNGASSAGQIADRTNVETRQSPNPVASGAVDHGQNHEPMNHGQTQGAVGHQVDLGPADADYDLRFIDAMIPHHEGAVSMAKEVLQKSQRAELKQLAQAMITAQQAEIDQMKQWRQTWYPKAPATPMMWHAEMKGMMPMDQTMIQAMRMDTGLGGSDRDFDKRFITAMIPHHEGALSMAADLKTKTQRSELQKMAQSILQSQQAEIDQMKRWRTAWYGS
jgi:uncharacterized protein (DUF305 family)